MDVKLGESSGVDAPRKKITFFTPAAFRGFLGVRGCAHGLRDRTRKFCCSIRKLDISSDITFSAGRINPTDMSRLILGVGILDNARTEAGPPP